MSSIGSEACGLLGSQGHDSGFSHPAPHLSSRSACHLYFWGWPRFCAYVCVVCVHTYVGMFACMWARMYAVAHAQKCTCVHGEAGVTCRVSFFFFQSDRSSLTSELATTPAHHSNLLSLPPRGWDYRPLPYWTFMWVLGGPGLWSLGLHSECIIYRPISPASFVSFIQLSPTKNALSTVAGGYLASFMCLSFPGKAKQPPRTS